LPAHSIISGSGMNPVSRVASQVSAQSLAQSYQLRPAEGSAARLWTLSGSATQSNNSSAALGFEKTRVGLR